MGLQRYRISLRDLISHEEWCEVESEKRNNSFIPTIFANTGILVLAVVEILEILYNSVFYLHNFHFLKITNIDSQREKTTLSSWRKVLHQSTRKLPTYKDNLWLKSFTLGFAGCENCCMTTQCVKFNNSNKRLPSSFRKIWTERCNILAVIDVSEGVMKRKSE